MALFKSPTTLQIQNKPCISSGTFHPNRTQLSTAARSTERQECDALARKIVYKRQRRAKLRLVGICYRGFESGNAGAVELKNWGSLAANTGMCRMPGHILNTTMRLPDCHEYRMILGEVFVFEVCLILMEEWRGFKLVLRNSLVWCSDWIY